jgi:hypothetical protein
VSRELNARLSSSAYSLKFPEALSPRDGGGPIDRYVQQGVSNSPEQAPFRRRIDLWAFGLSVAVAENLSPYQGPLRKFVDTRAVDVSDHVAGLVFSVAVAKLGASSPELDDTSKIVNICNEYAGAGVERVIEWLANSELMVTPLETVLLQAQELRQETGARLIGT